MEPRNLRDFAARNLLAAAFIISLVVHLTLFGTWRVGKALGWWEHQATWLLNLNKERVVKARQMAERAMQQQRQREIPLTFVEVAPDVATPEPPKEAKFYGAANSKASNPEPTPEAEKPKVDGTQTQVVRTETTPRFNPQPLQPSPPKPDPGDILNVPTKEKPRTLAAAREQKKLTGEKMKQEGGARQRGQLALDVKETPFGAYDALFIAAVQERWYNLLDSTQFAQRSGKVVVEFRLMHDGRITDMRIAGNEVGEMLGLLCQRAILDPAPYRPWPADMRRAVAAIHRDVRITFYYN